MQTTLLLLTTAVLPLAWGWSMHWLIVKLWPAPHLDSRIHAADPSPPAHPVDYQI